MLFPEYGTFHPELKCTPHLQKLDLSRYRTKDLSQEIGVIIALPELIRLILKTIGVLFILGGALTLIGGVLPLMNLKEGAEAFGVSLFLIGISLLYLFTGFGLRKLKRGARIPAVIICAIGLLGFPFGTLISAYFLYILCNRKAGRILTPAYQEIIAQTPHVKQKTSIFLWVLLAVLLGLIGLGIFLAFTAG